MTKLSVYNHEGEPVREVTWPDELLVGTVNPGLVHEVVTSQLAHQRRGTAKTKLRSEVKGSGAKPWRQKGTGRARAGTFKSPLWRGGGVTFGPVLRSYGGKIPRSKRRAAFKMVLTSKINDGDVHVIESIEMENPRTKYILDLLGALGVNDSALIVTAESDPVVFKSVRNISWANILPVGEVGPMHLVSYSSIVVTEPALEALRKRLEG